MKEPLPIPVFGVTDSLATGLQFAVKHLWLILIPLCLDLFFLFSPYVSSRPLTTNFLDWWQNQIELVIEDDEQLAENKKMIQFLRDQPPANLLHQLSLPVLGVPTVLSRLPFADQTEYILSPESAWWTFWGLNFAGIGLTVLFLGLIGYQFQEQKSWLGFGNYLWRTGWHFFLLLIALFVGIFLFMIPVLLIVQLVSLLSSGLALFVQFLAFIIFFWVAIYSSFALHGIFYSQRPFWTAFKESSYIVHRDAITVPLLLLTIMLVHNGFHFIWTKFVTNVPTALLAIGINSFLGTMLVAATFIFYQNRCQIFLTEEKG